MALTTRILNAQSPADATGAKKTVQRKKDDQGTVKVDFTPGSAPGTFTVVIEGRSDDPDTAEADSAWFAVTTITEAETASAAGTNTHAERLDLYPYMRAVSSNNDDATNHVQVWLTE